MATGIFLLHTPGLQKWLPVSSCSIPPAFRPGGGKQNINRIVQPPYYFVRKFVVIVIYMA
jgi:hypothetical protein